MVFMAFNVREGELIKSANVKLCHKEYIGNIKKRVELENEINKFIN